MEEAKERKEEEGENWSSAVEDLVDRGDIDGAISLLESLISKLKTLEKTSNLPLASALFDLADLYSSRGLSLKADELRNRALVIKLRSQRHYSRPLGLGDSNNASEAVRKNDLEESRASATDASPSSDNDDWEAIADLASNELLPPQVEAGVSNITLEDAKVQAPKRRGRGSFLYKKNGLYSDQAADGAPIDNSEDELSSQYPKEDADIRNSTYGMSHVLVLADFPPSTRTTDLEKVFEKFRDQGVVIRWVNDTVALAVFRNPSIANSGAKNRCVIRILLILLIICDQKMTLKIYKWYTIGMAGHYPFVSTSLHMRIILWCLLPLIWGRKWLLLHPLGLLLLCLWLSRSINRLLGVIGGCMLYPVIGKLPGLQERPATVFIVHL